MVWNFVFLSIIIPLSIWTMVTIDPIESKLFKRCESPGGTIETISISGCKDSDPYCIFKRGTNVTLNLTFTPTKSSNDVRVKIYGEIAKVPIPFNIDPEQACNNYGIQCPLVAGKKYDFTLEIPIKPVYPTIPVTIIAKLINAADQEKFACLKFKARISN